MVWHVMTSSNQFAQEGAILLSHFQIVKHQWQQFESQYRFSCAESVISEKCLFECLFLMSTIQNGIGSVFVAINESIPKYQESVWEVVHKMLQLELLMLKQQDQWKNCLRWSNQTSEKKTEKRAEINFAKDYRKGSQQNHHHHELYSNDFRSGRVGTLTPLASCLQAWTCEVPEEDMYCQ